jgi:hypothetical protein
LLQIGRLVFTSNGPAHMRLLDCIAQSRAPFLVEQMKGVVWRLRSACDFAAQLTTCPLRYVLSDELTRTCAALAYSEGHQLADCIDLLRIPAERLWVEWSDTVRRDEFLRTAPGGIADAARPDVLRAGVLIRAARSGRSGMMTTFWTVRDQPMDPFVAALETHFDFDGSLSDPGGLTALFGASTGSTAAGLTDGRDAIQKFIRYRLERTWLDYYQQHVLSDENRTRVLRDSLATVAGDLPLLLALSLLFATRGGLPATPSSLAALNAKRRRLGKPPLLEHVEISAPVFAEAAARTDSANSSWRRGPRLHHVRGHLVRREDVVYWRAPHWRGHVRLGRVRSRNVALKLM